MKFYLQKASKYIYYDILNLIWVFFLYEYITVERFGYALMVTMFDESLCIQISSATSISFHDN
jgi:hypothetical protein